MATPDHKARVHPSFTKDNHLTLFPDSSHSANPTAPPRSVVLPASMTRLGGSTLARRRRGVTPHAATWAACGDGQRHGARPASKAGAARAGNAIGMSR